MLFKSRKFFIWLITISVVIALYLLYTQLSDIPHIDIDSSEEFVETITDSNGKIWKIRDVGIGEVQVAEFINRNKKTKEVEEIFGFKKLINRIGDEWEIEEPYIKYFRKNFKCYVTADTGKFQIEAAAERPILKDALLTGNVLVHILPESTSKVKETFVYLDDVTFDSDQTMFSSAGDIKLISKDVRMLGRGLDFVYDSEQGILEFLRITNLESLRLHLSSNKSLFASSHKYTDDSINSHPRQTDISAAEDSSEAAHPLPTKKSRGELYRCLLSKNVAIRCPEQLVLADQISINNISCRKDSKTKSGVTDNEVDLEDEDEANMPGEIVGQSYKSDGNEIESVGSKNIDIQSTDVNTGEPNHFNESPNDIVVTCENGILVAPMDSNDDYKHLMDIHPEPTSVDTKNAETADGQALFVSPRIDHCMITGDTTATGPLKLRFEVNDVMATEADGNSLPMEITAKNKAEFSPSSNQVIFEGDSLCTMSRAKPNVLQKYILSAPKFTINLSQEKQNTAETTAAQVKHLTANGGVVHLATVKTAGDKLLGGIELKCHRFDFDSTRQICKASGPESMIKVDNSKIAQPDKSSGKFSLQRPCYGFVDGFDTLTYFMDSNEVDFEAASQRIQISYIPIVDGQPEDTIKASAGYIKALLYETEGRGELSSLIATNGISYSEKKIQFEGAKMAFDSKTAKISVTGDQTHPCLLNNAFVDGIEYNLKTDRLKTKIVAPGAFQLK